ncbi:c-type cytochrome [Gemmatimonas sp.]
MPAKPRRCAVRMTAVCALTMVAAATRSLPAQPTALPTAPAAKTFSAPAWAFPTAPPSTAPVPAPDSVTPHRVPNSARRYTWADVANRFNAPDWFPAQHPPMPSRVLYGIRPEGRACGYCHLPDGQGRPENATLAGLPAEYILRQMRAFRDGTRLSANPVSSTNSMHTAARGTPDDSLLVEAARYFSRLTPRRRNVVREVRHVPTTRIAGLLYAYDGHGTEPIDGRLIEVPESIERHELHDPWVRYTTYVPVGSLARGRRLATQGPAGVATACATCHGPDLLGVGEIPAIAGRAPTYVLRQLINFRTRARRDSTAAPMYAVVDTLTIDDMVALAAHIGSLPPTRSPRRASR